MTETATLTEEQKLGIRRANQAAMYANLRMVLAKSLADDNPIVGVHGFYIAEDWKTYLLGGGVVLPLSVMLSHVGGLQGKLLLEHVARITGDVKNAHIGDSYDKAINAPRCESCDDSDPTGAHALEELKENARAWLGLCVFVAKKFYGPHLPEEAREPLDKLLAMALPADADIS